MKNFIQYYKAGTILTPFDRMETIPYINDIYTKDA